MIEDTFDWTDNSTELSNTHYLNVHTDGRLWGFVSQGANMTYRQKFSWLSDSSGEKAVSIPAAFQNVSNRDVVGLTRTQGNWLYYSAGNDTDGDGGNQKLYRFDMQSGSSVEDLFAKVQSKGVGIRIWSIDIGDNYAYFTGSQGSDGVGSYNWIAGKIDLSTGEYTEMDPARKVTAIVAY
jgi:hypothetical protein